jgi:enhancing lycopene biosynthesis protein 2
MQGKKIAVVLSGCGNQDGAEIHESTLTLLAIHKHGANYQCFAPNIPQYHVLNHITGQEMDEQRNVLIESARIARGNIKDLKLFDPAEHDALIFPGGLGAAKNLSTYAFDGSDCTINQDVEHAVKAMYKAGKPIGALCIAPVILAKVLARGELTVGQDAPTADNLENMGAQHTQTTHGEIVVDRVNKIVSTPCYMLKARVDQIAEGAEKLVKAVLELTN